MIALQKLMTWLLKTVRQLTLSLFWLALWLFSLGVLATYLLRWWPGDRLLPVRLMNYGMAWLLLALAPGLLLALVARRRGLAFSLAVPLLLIGLNYAPLFMPRPSVALASAEPIRLMSYNVWGGNRDADRIAAVIKKQQPDLLLLQELDSSLADRLLPALADLYPEGHLHVAYVPRLEQAVLSRYPLTPLDSSRKKGKAQQVQVELPDGPVTVWNVHTTSFRGWRWRHNEVARLISEDIATAEGPVIVGGDFNTTDQTQTYRLIDHYLDNAHWEAGWGFGFSFPSPHRPIRGDLAVPSLVRIDHIFYSHHFMARSAATLANSGGSDHFPIVATLSRVR